MKRHVKRYNCEIQNAEFSHDGCDIGGVASVKPRRGSLSCKKPFHLFVLVVWAFVSVSFADISVTGVTVRQLEPWGRVEIAMAIAGSSNEVAEAICTFAATNGATKAELPIEHIIDRGITAGSGEMWTRTYIWNVFADVGSVKINDIALTAEARIPWVQLWKNGPCWAECNVGATKPEEEGYYFWWGDTVGYTYDNGVWVSSAGTRMSSSPFTEATCPTYNKSKSTLMSRGYINAKGNLTAAYDAATAHLGAPWRMPTDGEMQQLINNCTTTWTTRNGVYGRLVTGKGSYSAKSIFLPASGYSYNTVISSLGSTGDYWSSTPNSDDSNCAWYLNLESSSYWSFCLQDHRRYYGRSVRPLR